MFPISDDNPTLRRPIITWMIVGLTALVWLLFQGAGLDLGRMAYSVCDFGMVPGEITKQARVGFAVPLGGGWACVVDREAINTFTPITSMFLHGSWGHIIGNMMFFWVFGNNVEDSMGHARFVLFYLLCGIAAAAAHVYVTPSSPVPTVGASGAVSGIMGAYLVLFPHVRVRMLFWFLLFIRVIPIRAWIVLLWWFAWQVISGLPELMQMRPEISGGVAVWAHVGGFVTGALLIKLFARKEFLTERAMVLHANKTAGHTFEP